MPSEPIRAHNARERLAEVRGQLSDEQQLALAVQLAEVLWRQAQTDRSRSERARDRVLARMMADAPGQAFTTLITDRAFRTRQPRKLAGALSHLVRELGTPRFLSRTERVQLAAARRLGWALPAAITAGLDRRIRSESGHLLLPSDDAPLAKHLARRRAEGVRVNLNHLGEAVLGEAEARRRCDTYRTLLARPDVDAIAVKLSSIFSQVDLTAFEHTLAMLKTRLREVYRAALAHPRQTPDGVERHALVTLDMEAYHDLDLTLGLFMGVLEEPEFMPLQAGVVLQAYLPDSACRQEALTRWASQRVARGGAPIRLRIVKGANLATEAVEASLRGWPSPIYPGKAAVDANYKRMVSFGCQPEHARVVHLGLASHNVFDLAFGLVLRAHHNVERHVGLELLEGMADPLRRALQTVCDDVLVYAPVVERNAMQSAIAYLVRRLDENAGPDNFLHHSFGMQVGDAAWQAQADCFRDSWRKRERVSSAPLRTQDRSAPLASVDTSAAFHNEPDTDFAAAANRRWLTEHLARTRDAPARAIPLQIAGEHSMGAALANGFDPSRPAHVPYRHALANADDIERALSCAQHQTTVWGRTGLETRAAILAEVAQHLRRKRGELIASMVLDAGKRPEQADVEVSEAIDFAEYYPRSLRALATDGVTLSGRGPTVVTPPWNFPLAIPAGGVVAALCAGNPVILKPAPETVLVAATFAELCWEAGVPMEALQLCLCEDDVGSQLVRDPRVTALILTGATDTARLFQRMRPDLWLLAETGGKNALIVTALADRDLAIANVVQSAFAHAGQKCSAASLLICEAEVYDDPTFQAQLKDAAESLPVGSAWKPASVITPLIRPPSGPLQKALHELAPGESWLLEPRPAADNPNLWSPGIRWDVQRDAFCHRTELFGPVLSVMRAADLYEAIEFANGTGYGLTSGLHSLDEREHGRWLRRIRAGNLYINRGTTGAIVRRQPFGGYDGSCFGPGAKAGGPNYILQLMNVRCHQPPPVEHPPALAAAELLVETKRLLPAALQRRLAQVACSYGAAQAQHFGLEHDPSQVRGERNIFRYRPLSPMVVRWTKEADELDKRGGSTSDDTRDDASTDRGVLEQVLMACTAALTAGADFSLSLPPEVATRHDALMKLRPLRAISESPEDLAKRIAPLARIRALGTLEPAVISATQAAGVHLDHSAALPDGRFELAKYVEEQSVTIAYHRHGNLAAERLQSG